MGLHVLWVGRAMIFGTLEETYEEIYFWFLLKT